MSGTAGKTLPDFIRQVDTSDRRISNPLNGLESNDLLLTTGVRVAFGGNEGF